jgi:hypothetical protein
MIKNGTAGIGDYSVSPVSKLNNVLKIMVKSIRDSHKDVQASTYTPT